MPRIEQCPACCMPLALFPPRDALRHVNECLDGLTNQPDTYAAPPPTAAPAPASTAALGPVECAVCQRDITSFTLAAREEHINRCLDKSTCVTASATASASTSTTTARPRTRPRARPRAPAAAAAPQPTCDPKVVQLLESLGLARYASRFAREEIDLDALRLLNEQDLVQLRIPEAARRHIAAALTNVTLLRDIAGVQSQAAPAAAPLPTQKLPPSRLAGASKFRENTQVDQDVEQHLYGVVAGGYGDDDNDSDLDGLYDNPPPSPPRPEPKANAEGDGDGDSDLEGLYDNPPPPPLVPDTLSPAKEYNDSLMRNDESGLDAACLGAVLSQDGIEKNGTTPPKDAANTGAGATLGCLDAKVSTPPPPLRNVGRSQFSPIAAPPPASRLQESDEGLCKEPMTRHSARLQEEEKVDEFAACAQCALENAPESSDIEELELWRRKMLESENRRHKRRLERIDEVYRNVRRRMQENTSPHAAPTATLAPTTTPSNEVVDLTLEDTPIAPTTRTTNARTFTATSPAPKLDRTRCVTEQDEQDGRDGNSCSKDAGARLWNRLESKQLTAFPAPDQDEDEEEDDDYEDNLEAKSFAQRVAERCNKDAAKLNETMGVSGGGIRTGTRTRATTTTTTCTTTGTTVVRTCPGEKAVVVASDSSNDELVDLTQPLPMLMEGRSRDTVCSMTEPRERAATLAPAVEAGKKRPSRLKRGRRCTHAQLRSAVRKDAALYDQVLQCCTIDPNALANAVTRDGLKASWALIDEFALSEGINVRARQQTNPRGNTSSARYFRELCTQEHYQ